MSEGFAAYRQLVLEIAQAHDYPADLLAAQCSAESDWDPEAISSAGALGLMQFMLDTWHEWGEGSRLDPRAALDAGCRYMLWLLDKFSGWPNPTECALAAYNYGIGNVRRARNKAADAGRPEPTSWATLVPYLPQETRAYVKRIMDSRARYAARLREIAPCPAS